MAHVLFFIKPLCGRLAQWLWFEAKTEQKIKLLNFVSANFFIKGEKIRYELKEPLSLIGKTALRQTWWSIGHEFRTLALLHYVNIKAATEAMAA